LKITFTPLRQKYKYILKPFHTTTTPHSLQSFAKEHIHSPCPHTTSTTTKVTMQSKHEQAHVPFHHKPIACTINLKQELAHPCIPLVATELRPTFWIFTCAWEKMCTFRVRPVCGNGRRSLPMDVARHFTRTHHLS